MNFRNLILAVVLGGIVTSSPGCTYIKGIFSPNTHATSGGPDTLVINQRTYDLTNQSDLRASLHEVQKLNRDIQSRIEQAYPTTLSSDNALSNSECRSVYRNSESNCTDNQVKEKNNSVFVH